MNEEEALNDNNGNTPLPSDDLQAIVEQFNASHWRELELEFHGTKLFLSKNSGASPEWIATRAASVPQSLVAPAAQAAPVAASPSQSGPNLSEGQVVVNAPSLGTFYRSPKPGAAPFAQIGDLVESETELCLIEVMKLFTTLRAGVKGRLVDILVEDGVMVEHDQPLFVIAVDG
ncbi:MAG: biotin/lipoyl-containing protein [Pseudomonadota bacterium]